MKIFFLIAFLSLLNYTLITTIVDFFLMGVLHFGFAMKCRKKNFLITKTNRIDLQDGYKCSAFSSAYVLRHWDVEENGNCLYEVMPNKMRDGYVYPKGIQNLLLQYGFKTKYCIGNITALKNEISKGNPVIVLIRVQAGKNWLHYVPIVGYDEHYIFIAESLEELVNHEGQYYNRKVEIKEFVKLWNTSMIKMPFYRNTYIVVDKKDKM